MDVDPASEKVDVEAPPIEVDSKAALDVDLQSPSSEDAKTPSSGDEVEHDPIDESFPAHFLEMQEQVRIEWIQVKEKERFFHVFVWAPLLVCSLPLAAAHAVLLLTGICSPYAMHGLRHLAHMVSTDIEFSETIVLKRSENRLAYIGQLIAAPIMSVLLFVAFFFVYPVMQLVWLTVLVPVFAVILAVASCQRAFRERSRQIITALRQSNDYFARLLLWSAFPLLWDPQFNVAAMRKIVVQAVPPKLAPVVLILYLIRCVALPIVDCVTDVQFVASLNIIEPIDDVRRVDPLRAYLVLNGLTVMAVVATVFSLIGTLVGFGNTIFLLSTKRATLVELAGEQSGIVRTNDFVSTRTDPLRYWLPWLSLARIVFGDILMLITAMLTSYYFGGGSASKTTVSAVIVSIGLATFLQSAIFVRVATRQVGNFLVWLGTIGFAALLVTAFLLIDVRVLQAPF